MFRSACRRACACANALRARQTVAAATRSKTGRSNKGKTVISVHIPRDSTRDSIVKLLNVHELEWWEGGSLSDTMTAKRKAVLDSELRKLGIDADELERHDTANLSHQAETANRTEGMLDYMPALRTYQHFIWPRQKHISNAISDSVSITRVAAAAGRCARHVEMLMRQAEVRADDDFRNLDADRDTQTLPAEEHGQDVDLNTTTGSSKGGESACNSSDFRVALVLDNVRSAFNTGNILRTAECVGLASVILCGITPRADNAAVAKAAMGAQHKLSHIDYVENTVEAVKDLRKAGYNIVSLETHADAVSYSETDWAELARIRPAAAPATQRGGRCQAPVLSGGVAIVVGHEVVGVRHQVLRQSDAIVEVPCYGVKNSLNVSSLVPVVTYEVDRQLRATTAAAAATKSTPQ